MTLACRESRVHAVQPFHTMHFGAKYRHLHTRLAALRARRSERRSRALSHVKMPSQNRLPHEPTLRRPDNASDARRARIVTVTHNQSLTPPHNQAVAPRRPHQIGYPLGRQSGASCGNIFECFAAIALSTVSALAGCALRAVHAKVHANHGAIPCQRSA